MSTKDTGAKVGMEVGFGRPYRRVYYGTVGFASWTNFSLFFSLFFGKNLETTRPRLPPDNMNIKHAPLFIPPSIHPPCKKQLPGIERPASGVVVRVGC